MGRRIDEFLESQSSRFSYSIFKKLNAFGYDDDFLDNYLDNVIEQIILDMKPKSKRTIFTICSIFGSYARFIGNNEAYWGIRNIDKNLLWKKAKPNAEQKYISYESFLNILYDISCFMKENTLYYNALFRTIYNGIYCNDMSVIANLKASDIYGNMVELHRDDGYSYKMIIPDDLAKDLKKLAEINEWERKNRRGVYTVKISGKFPDSCFKIDKRKGESITTYKVSYYNKLRKITKEYLNYYLPPSQLFISGIMYRICLELDKNNISVMDAFSEMNRNRTVISIIRKELSRCEYDIPVKLFREQVEGHLEVFTT